MIAAVIELAPATTIVEDTQGDHIMVTQFIKARSHYEARAWANATFQPTRCQHSYDCCGRYYQHYPATVKLISKEYSTYVVVADLYHNV